MVEIFAQVKNTLNVDCSYVRARLINALSEISRHAKMFSRVTLTNVNFSGCVKTWQNLRTSKVKKPQIIFVASMPVEINI